MIITKSTKEKEYASAEFLKWFTAPEQNLRFISETGYLPVTRNAFEIIIDENIDKAVDTNIKKLLRTAASMYGEYDFYVPPVFDEFDSLEKDFVQRIKQAASDARSDYLSLLEKMDSEEAFTKATEGVYENFIKGR